MIFRMITGANYAMRNYKTYQENPNWKQTTFFLFLQKTNLLITLKDELHCEREKLCMLPREV